MKYVGVLIPETNIVVEDEIIKLISEDINIFNKVSFHFSRIEVRKDYSKNEKAFLQEVYKNIEKALKLLKFIPLEVVGFFCTSAILFRKTNDKKIFDKLNNIPILNPLQALTLACSKVKPHNVLLFSPYNYFTAKSLEKFLQNKGVPISKNIFLSVNRDIDKYDLRQAKKLIIDSLSKKVDLILISCTNFRSLELITYFESKFRIPVISSNQALFWLLCKKLNIQCSAFKKYGLIFQL